MELEENGNVLFLLTSIPSSIDFADDSNYLFLLRHKCC